MAFVETVLVDPETGQRFELYSEQREFLRRALKLTPEGRLPFSELVFSAPKKAGKTAMAAMIALYVALARSPRFGEVYCSANDFDQAQGRVFAACVRIVESSPILAGSAKITANKVEFTSTGSSIVALPADYAGAAGANPSLTIFDELWAYVSERSMRLWNEMVPPPTRKVAARLTVTYAGFEGESTLLEDLHRRALGGKQVAADTDVNGHQLTYWTHRLIAPWQTPGWREQMRATSRPAAFTRQIENRFTSGTEAFVSLDAWDACVDRTYHPVLADTTMPVWVGVDASTKRDSTAIVAVTWNAEARRVRLVAHKIFQPTRKDPLDFEATIEKTLLELRGRFSMHRVFYDPYQLHSSADRLRRMGLSMEEFPQSTPNLTDSGTNLYDLIRDRNLVAYPDDAIRRAIAQTVAVETPRGWRLAKEKTSHKIDVVAAMSFAALAAVRDAFRPKGTRLRYRVDEPPPPEPTGAPAYPRHLDPTIVAPLRGGW